MSGSIFLGRLGAAAAAARRLRAGRAIFVLRRVRCGRCSRRPRPISENSVTAVEYTPCQSAPRPRSVQCPTNCASPTQESPVSSVMPVIHSASRTTQAPTLPSTGLMRPSSQVPTRPPPMFLSADNSRRPQPQTTTRTRPAPRTAASTQDQSPRFRDGARYKALKPITAAGKRYEA